jgi:hypothetical protein
MKFKVLFRSGKEEWWEQFDLPCEDARAEAEKIVANFNAVLENRGEFPAILDVVVVNDEQNPKEHIWRQTSPYIQSYGAQRFDTFVCENCGVTGKRLEGQQIIRRDHTFKGKVYADCDKAKARLDGLRGKSIC